MVRNRLERRKRRNPGRYIIAIVVVVVSFGIVNSGRSLFKIADLVHMKKEEKKALITATAKRDSLKEEVVRLTTDSLYIEEIARRDYGMVRPGEEVYNITLPDTTGEAEKHAGRK